MIKQAEQSFSLHDFGRLLFRNRKQAGVYGLSFIFISFNLCLFLPANMHTPSATRMVNAIQLFCFAVMGIINVWFFYRSSFLSGFSFSKAKLAFISLLFVLMGLVLFVYYYLSGNDGLVMAFASSGSFLLPFLVYQGWIEFVNIPEKEYTAWYLPEDRNSQAAGGLPATASKTMQVQVKVARSLKAENAHMFPVVSPGKQKLGKMFEKFIEEQQLQGKHAVIETKYGKNTFGWRFFEERWFGLYRRNLNPAKSLVENKIKSDTTIAVIRIYNDDVLTA